MRARLDRWIADRLTTPLGWAQVLIAVVALTIASQWAATWSANIVTTWAQTVLFQAQSASADKGSVARWSETRGQWAARLDRLEQACRARR